MFQHSEYLQVFICLYFDLSISLGITLLASVKTNKDILTSFATTLLCFPFCIYFSSFILNLSLFYLRFVRVSLQMD